MREGRGPVCPSISTKGQSDSPQHCADETRRGQNSDNIERKGAAISTNETGGLKAFYFEAICLLREQSVLFPWLPGTLGRKGFGGRRGGGLRESGGRQQRGGRARDENKRVCFWLGRFLPFPFPSKTSNV